MPEKSAKIIMASEGRQISEVGRSADAQISVPFDIKHSKSLDALPIEEKNIGCLGVLKFDLNSIKELVNINCNSQKVDCRLKLSEEESNKSLVETLLDEISKGNIEKVIEKLMEVSTRIIVDKAVYVSSRYRRLNNLFYEGLVTYGQYSCEENRITIQVIRLVHELE